MIEKREKLIKYYTQLLEKLKIAWGGNKIVGESYIAQAEKDLQEVINGREW